MFFANVYKETNLLPEKISQDHVFEIIVQLMRKKSIPHYKYIWMRRDEKRREENKQKCKSV